MQRLLVPVDGSESAQKAVEFAAEQARGKPSEITLLFVATEAGPGVGSFFAHMPGVEEREAKLAQASFERARSALQGLQIKAHLVELGHPADRILDVARRLGITHIVMGNRGRSPISELLLGSVSDRVVREAQCPVTIVR